MDDAQSDQRSWETEMFRLLVETVRDYAIFVENTHGQVQNWNPGAERLLGYRADEIIGQGAGRAGHRTDPCEEPRGNARRYGAGSRAGLDRGSEFVVRLPLRTRKQEESSERKDSEPSHQTTPPSGHRLLVVDDNRDAADSLALLLRLQGHEVHVAYDGPAALEAINGFQPEMVFLDIGMPRMDGYELARRLRPDLEKLRLIALTGWGQQEDRRRTAEAGFDHHLVKPVEPAALKRMLGELNSETS